jgi:hypothetical protein
MIDIGHLEKKTIILKLPSMSKAISGTVVKVEKDYGLWIMDGELSRSLSEFGFPAVLEKPALFVPLTSIEWLMVASESDVVHQEFAE